CNTPTADSSDRPGWSLAAARPVNGCAISADKDRPKHERAPIGWSGLARFDSRRTASARASNTIRLRLVLPFGWLRRTHDYLDRSTVQDGKALLVTDSTHPPLPVSVPRSSGG